MNAQPSATALRLIDGDIDLTVTELLTAMNEIKFALEINPPEDHKVGLRKLLIIAEDLVKSKTN